MDRRSFLNSTTVPGGAVIALHGLTHGQTWEFVSGPLNPVKDLTGASLYAKTLAPQQA